MVALISSKHGMDHNASKVPMGKYGKHFLGIVSNNKQKAARLSIFPRIVLALWH